jgi:predicted nuclease of restriction endonuclease-like RecB superfamily
MNQEVLPFIFHPSSFEGPSMLTGKMVRVRYARDRILPHYLNAQDPAWLEVAERLLELFRGQEGRTRGELEQDLVDTFGDDPGQLVHQGLAKLLEDRCEFEVVSGHPPEQLRAAAFGAAARARQEGDTVTGPPAGPVPDGSTSREPEPGGDGSPCHLVTLSPCQGFDRDAVLRQVAGELGLTPEAVEQGLFADLKSEQRLARFEDISPERLLHRYNVALAQAVLLRSTRVHVTVRGEPPQRYRQLLRQVKFHRLVCEVERLGTDTYQLHLDGPLSLFAATQKYGLQLALFLPAVLLCRNFELRAELRWGAQRRPKTFVLTHADGLVSHYRDAGMYVPPELGMFVELFRKRVEDWAILEETDVFPLGGGFWVPDFRLVHAGSGRVVRLEVLGFWRRASAEQHLARLRQHVREPFLLAVSDQLHIEEAELDGLPAGIHRFRNMPLPDEVARLARELLASTPGER